MVSAFDGSSRLRSHDAGEPGRNGGAAFERAQVKIGGKQRILDRVFGAFLISQNAVSYSEESRV
jgi:hypothetical protein